MPCHAVSPKMDGSGWRVLTKRGLLEEEMATHSSILATRTPGTAWKGKKIWYLKINSSGRKVSSMLLGKTRGQLLIVPERNEVSGPKWKRCSVVDVSDGESKVWYCKEQYCIGTWNVSSMNQGKLCQLQIGTYQEHCQPVNNKGICHLPLGRLDTMLL